MEKLIVKVGASSDHFGAFAENCPDIYGAGNTVQEAKENVLDGLNLFIEQNRNNLPDILKGNYEIEYKFDIPSFLSYYSKIFTKPALERITGINQKQLFHYESGHRNPSEKTVKKIEDSIHKFTEELRQIHFT
jgi:predicted RNase H-like HicB family nuclease